MTWITAVSSRVRLHVVALVLTCILQASLASGASVCGSLDRVIVAVRLAQTLYPEVKGREFSVAFSEGTGGPASGPADARSLAIKLDAPQWHPPERRDGESKVTRQSPPVQHGAIPLPLYLSFNFIDFDSVGRDIVCRPVGFINHSSNKLMEETQTIINAHAEWTDKEALETAKQHGLRFAPPDKAAVLRRVPLSKLSTFYGPLRVTKIRFETYGNPDKTVNSSFTDLRWYIDADEIGTGRTLAVVVEPFGGKIVSIGEFRQSR